MKKGLIVLALAAITTLVVASTAQAHILSFKRANQVSFSVAERDCNNDPGCTEFGSFKRDCRRGSAHRVRCFALNIGFDSSGAQYGCVRPVLVKMKNDSYQRVFVTGQRSCQYLRGSLSDLG